jgi:hypothetical protein
MTMLVSNDPQSKRAPESVILSGLLDIPADRNARASDFIATRLRRRPGSSYQEQHLDGEERARFAALPLEHDLC